MVILKKIGSKWGMVLLTLLGRRSLAAAEIPKEVTLAPKRKQRLVLNNGTEVQSLDPHFANGRPEFDILNDLVEGLFIYNIEGQVIPGVVLRWESEDLKTWIFYLRPDTQWSNGDQLTAHDFVYAWQRLANKKTGAQLASYLVEIKLLNSKAVLAGHKPVNALGITALDKHTLKVELSQPIPYLIEKLTHTAFAPLHKATLERYGDQWTKPAYYVGNGAYQLKKWIPHEKIVLQRNAAYWNDSQTVIEQVTYLPLTSSSAEIAAYKIGAIDISQSVPAERIPQLKIELPEELYIFPLLNIHGYGLNTKNPPFDDVRVRQALSMTVDREAIVSQVLKNRGDRAAYQFTPVGMEAFDPVLPLWTRWDLAKRQQEAGKLLQAAGYSAQKPLQFNLLYNINDSNKEMAIAVSSMWQECLPVKVTLEQQEWATFLSCRGIGDYQMARLGRFSDSKEPIVLLDRYKSSNLLNDVFYKNPVFDQWLEKAVLAKDKAERAHCYQQAEIQLSQDVPLIPILHGVGVRLIKPYVGGFNKCNATGTFFTKDLYITVQKK